MGCPGANALQTLEDHCTAVPVPRVDLFPFLCLHPSSSLVPTLCGSRDISGLHGVPAVLGSEVLERLSDQLQGPAVVGTRGARAGSSASRAGAALLSTGTVLATLWTQPTAASVFPFYMCEHRGTERSGDSPGSHSQVSGRPRSVTTPSGSPPALPRTEKPAHPSREATVQCGWMSLMRRRWKIPTLDVLFIRLVKLKFKLDRARSCEQGGTAGPGVGWAGAFEVGETRP